MSVVPIQKEEIEVGSHRFPLWRTQEIDSTNLFLQRELEQNSAFSFGAFFAERQTAGIGRLGREWKSPQGGFYLSMVSPVGETKPHLFGIVASIALVEVLRTYTPSVFLKWPNDILALDANQKERKLGGILSQFVAKTGQVIVGIGCNIHSLVQLDTPTVFPPISLSELCEEMVSIDDFLHKVIKQVAHSFLRLREGEDSFLLKKKEQYKEYSMTLGKRVQIQRVKGSLLSGIAMDVLDDFSLVISNDAGHSEVVQEGDCFHARPNGD